MTMQTEQLRTTAQGGAMVWIFRVLLIAAAAFMVYSWMAPWWGATVSVLKGADHLLLRPWGVDVVSQVRANIDEALFSMPYPQVFAGLMWTYLAVCMLALAFSLFTTRIVTIGRFRIPLAVILILLVGLSYMFAAGMAFAIGELKAQSAGANFIGKSMVKEPQSGAKIKMMSDLKPGFWLALGAGGAITLLGLLRAALFRTPKV
jgi:hypothetical protein